MKLLSSSEDLVRLVLSKEEHSVVLDYVNEVSKQGDESYEYIRELFQHIGTVEDDTITLTLTFRELSVFVKMLFENIVTQ